MKITLVEISFSDYWGYYFDNKLMHQEKTNNTLLMLQKIMHQNKNITEVNHMIIQNEWFEDHGQQLPTRLYKLPKYSYQLNKNGKS